MNSDYQQKASRMWTGRKASHGTFGRLDHGYIDGDGPYAVVSLCGGDPRVTLHPKAETAKLEFDLLDGNGEENGLFALVGCSMGCERNHAIWDLTEKPRRVA